MLEIVAKDYTDEDYDSCGNTTIATLRMNGIKIPLCSECIEELTESLDVFNNTIFCHKCEKFIMSESGWRYGGSCRKDKEVESKDAGYICCVDCMDTCKDAIIKS